MMLKRTAWTILIALALTVTVALPALAQPKRLPACEAELGARRAAELLRDCRAVSLDARACRPDAPCATLRDATRLACEEAGADALPPCERHVEIDDDEDE